MAAYPVPSCPAGTVVVAGIDAGTTSVIGTCALTLTPAWFVTVIVYVVVPPVVPCGVPVIAPVLGLIDTPVGKAGLIAYVSVPVPVPAAWKVYPVPTIMFGAVVVVTLGWVSTIRVTAVVAEPPPPLLAVNVAVYVPASPLAGVPDHSPVVLLSARAPGSAGLAVLNTQLTTGEPPVEAKECDRLCPTVAYTVAVPGTTGVAYAAE